MCHLILFLPVLTLPVFWIFPFNTALPLYFSILGISLLIYFKIFKAMRQQVLTGFEGMFEKKGLVVEDIDPEGKIKYASEIWGAETKGNRFLKGQHVMICGIRGMMLLVEEIPAGGNKIEKRKCH